MGTKNPTLLMIPAVLFDVRRHVVGGERRADFRPAMNVTDLEVLRIRWHEDATLPIASKDHVHVKELPALWQPRHDSTDLNSITLHP